MKYQIVRFFKEKNKTRRIIKKGLTLEEARKHCNNTETEKKEKWFDSYETDIRDRIK